MKRTELQQAIEEIIIEILSPEEQKAKASAIASSREDIKDATNDLKTATTPIQKRAAQDQLNLAKKDLAQAGAMTEAEDEDDDSTSEKEPSKAELKKIDKEFNTNKFAKKLSDEEKSKLDKIEAGIKKKLANPTKDNIAIIKQLIAKSEIKKLFKDGGKDLKALVSDIIA
jgi:hypothetical protein